MSFLYLGALLVSLAGIVAIDVKYRLALAHDFKRGASVLAIATAFFLGWDLLGIGLGIFFRGASTHLTGIVIAPELPIEEVFFLVLLSYTTLIIFTALERARRVKP